MQILSRDSDLMFNPRDRSATGGDALMRSADEARQTLPAQVAATRQRLDMLSLEKRRWAIWVSMGLSAGLALSGFQILHGAVAAQLGGSGLPPAQLQLFAFVDVCLTTVVLAGGAGGIHRIISRVLDFGQTSKTGIVPD